MPTYDYRCDACGNVFEVKRSFSEASKTAACPDDGAEATRLFSPPLDMIVYGKEYTTKVTPPSSAPTSGGSFGHGHSHGPGGHTHSHGPGSHTH
jgi:putative FmdB family regulatory protein